MKVGVLGAGIMGAGIAQAVATAGHDTICFDVDPAALPRAEEHVTAGRYGWDRGVALGKITRAEADAARARLSFTDSFATAAETDVVVEAVFERLDVKQQVFRDLDAAAPAGTILASNTSGFPIAQLAAVTGRPELVIGWHWASPPTVMRMAEIVRGPATSDATVATVVDLATACGKRPVVINDSPTETWGFVSNRLYSALVREAAACKDEGVATDEQIDTIMVDCFRWPVGPLGMVRGATTGWGQ